MYRNRSTKKRFCATGDLFPSLSNLVINHIISATRHWSLFLLFLLHVKHNNLARKSVAKVLLGTVDLHVTLHEMFSPGHYAFMLGTCALENASFE